MSSRNHERVLDVLGAVLDAAPPDRDKLILQLCDDESLRMEVERLLKFEGSAAAILPDDAGAVEWLAHESSGAPQRQSVDSHRLAPGIAFGSYVIGPVLGEGGMGVVYRATDVRLERPVAIKVISTSLESDLPALARFSREAKILASLNHPNVATAYGLEEFDGAKYLVMELIDGDSLSERLARGKLSISEALSIAAQIAAGVSSAHDAGVIHRDLKPGNIMLTRDGMTKVLDFGLARETTRPLIAGAGIDGPELQGDVSAVGAVVGTPRYMSPEQVRGLPVDRRTDVFSFGSVFYEMLTGAPAFNAKSFPAIAAKILEEDPDFAALPISMPPSAKRLLRRMLEKDPARRLRDLGDVRADLEESLAERSWNSLSGAVVKPPRRATRIGIAALLAVVAVAGAALWRNDVGKAANVKPVGEHFVLPFPNNYEQTDLARIRLALSGDDGPLVISASDAENFQLWRRDRGEIEFSPITDTLGAWIPAVSRDGRNVAYYQHGYVMRSRVDGGEAVRVADHASYAGRIAWNGDDELLFTPAWGEGVACVPLSGATPRMLTQPEHQNGDMAHMSPAPTPDGRFVLFTVWDGKQGTRIDAIRRDGTGRHIVVEQGECGRFAATPAGLYVLYTRHGTLFAAPFDAEHCRRSGPGQAIVDQVLFNRALFEPVYDVADDGTLAYVPGPSFNEEMRLTWLGDDGQSTPLNNSRDAYAEPHFSGDGKHVSVLVRGEVYRPYVLNLEQQTVEPVVSDSDTESCAISPDGKSVAYSSNRSGPFEIWIQDLATHADRKLPFEESTRYQIQICWSPDSRYVAFSMASESLANWDIWIGDVQSGNVRRFCDRPSEERAPQFSPDGRWLAYSSDEAGGREIRLRRFPDGSLDRQITAGGAEWPQWSPDGKKLYFRRDQKLWSVPLDLESGSTAGRPSIECDRDFGQSDFELSDYTIAPDGRTLLVEPSERGPRVSAVHVLLNWYVRLAK
jgi:eukaryotic-like serine/threonine-protein kinase